MQLTGASAVVVGGTGGMGEATVRRLHAAGVKVVVADVNDEKGKALEAELGVRYLHTDAGSEDDVTAAFAAAAESRPPPSPATRARSGSCRTRRPRAGCWA